MTFSKSPDLNFTPFALLTPDCFGCGKPVEGATIRYDGYGVGSRMMSLLFHPKCANEVGQRLIIDSWPNRTADPNFERSVT